MYAELDRTKYLRDWSLRNKAKTKEYKKRYAEKNPEKVAKAKATYREKNRIILNVKSREYGLKNKKSVLARTRRYQAAKRKAVPSWSSEEMIKKIRLFYERCESGYHVDHIVPLRGKNVCGLHVWWNLQYLEPKANQKKSNKI